MLFSISYNWLLNKFCFVLIEHDNHPIDVRQLESLLTLHHCDRFLVILIFYGIHVRNVVHGHQAGEYCHNHFRFHLGDILW